MEGVVRVVQATGRLSMSAASFAAWASAGVSGVMVTAGDTNGTSRGSASAVATSAGTAEADPLDVPLVSPAVTITPLTPADAHAAKLAALIDSLPVAWTTRTTPSM